MSARPNPPPGRPAEAYGGHVRTRAMDEVPPVRTTARKCPGAQGAPGSAVLLLAGERADGESSYPHRDIAVVPSGGAPGVNDTGDRVL